MSTLKPLDLKKCPTNAETNRILCELVGWERDPEKDMPGQSQ